MTTSTRYTVEISRDAAVWLKRMETTSRDKAKLEYKRFCEMKMYKGFHVRLTRRHVEFDVMEEYKL